MPGDLICASCPCGFEAVATPGYDFTTPGDELVMACNSNNRGQGRFHLHSQSGADELLATLPESEARKRGLEIIKNPALVADPLSGDRLGPWSGYKCPRCGAKNMTLSLAGHWD